MTAARQRRADRTDSSIHAAASGSVSPASPGRAEHVRQRLRRRTMLAGLRLKLAPDVAGGTVQTAA